jgi:hypothetical protein
MRSEPNRRVTRRVPVKATTIRKAGLGSVQEYLGKIYASEIEKLYLIPADLIAQHDAGLASRALLI